ncbi:TPA: hypothetical protein ACGE0Z_002425 [Klebsiella pneumoniae]
MAFKRSLCLALGVCISLPVVATETEGFNQYVEGALKVYSQFQKPSKQESEQFYSFIKNKWSTVSCTSECSVTGINAGLQYASQMRIPLDHEVQ